jgi:hypothetical protein
VVIAKTVSLPGVIVDDLRLEGLGQTRPTVEPAVEDREPSIFTVTRIHAIGHSGPLPASHGFCLVEVAGIGQVSAPIYDRALESLDNVYGRAFNSQRSFQVEAKAWRRDGKIVRLGILHASDVPAGMS